MADQIIAAGLCIRAADTGRVLMIQRSIADESDPARGDWEFPGGKLDSGETPLQAAIREWQEEIGMTLPNGDFAGSWSGGVYQGFVYVIPAESEVVLNADPDDRRVLNPDDPDGDDIEVAAWWTPSDARATPALRDECAQTTDWNVIDRAVPNAVFKQRLEVVVKDSPTASETHVDAPLATGKRRRRRRRAAVEVVKADPMRQLVYGVVLEPHVEDSQGDWERPIEIEKAAHRYLAKAIRGRARVHTVQHRARAFFPSGGGLVPVESFIAPCDFRYDGSTDVIRKGSWVLAAHVEDPKLWQDVLDGKFTGWSVGGTGRRIEVVGRST